MRGASEQVAELLKSARAPHRLGLIGFGIVAIAFLASVVNALLLEPSAFIAKTLMPFIFVGLASLLYHIGQHVHAMHQNALRMIAMDRESSMASPEHGMDKGDVIGES